MLLATEINLARELVPYRYRSFAIGLARAILIAPLATSALQGFWREVFGLEGWRAIRWLKPSARFSVFTTTKTLLIFITRGFLDLKDFPLVDCYPYLIPKKYEIIISNMYFFQNYKFQQKSISGEYDELAA